MRGIFFLKKNLPGCFVAQVRCHHYSFQTNLFGLACHESPFATTPPPPSSGGLNDLPLRANLFFALPNRPYPQLLAPPFSFTLLHRSTSLGPGVWIVSRKANHSRRVSCPASSFSVHHLCGSPTCVCRLQCSYAQGANHTETLQRSCVPEHTFAMADCSRPRAERGNSCCATQEGAPPGPAQVPLCPDPPFLCCP